MPRNRPNKRGILVVSEQTQLCLLQHRSTTYLYFLTTVKVPWQLSLAKNLELSNRYLLYFRVFEPSANSTDMQKKHQKKYCYVIYWWLAQCTGTWDWNSLRLLSISTTPHRITMHEKITLRNECKRWSTWSAQLRENLFLLFGNLYGYIWWLCFSGSHIKTSFIVHLFFLSMAQNLPALAYILVWLGSWVERSWAELSWVGLGWTE